MATRKITDCIPELQQAWEEGCRDFKSKHPSLAQPFLTCCFRDKIEQQADYDQGRTKPGKIITNAKPGQSLHNDYPSRAIDVCFKDVDGHIHWDYDLYLKFAECIKPYGAHWGGDWKGFKDYPHYEIPKTI
jgi:peptidoglycan L-alanyl-D-glutamate endopeptidase CwlK